MGPKTEKDFLPKVYVAHSYILARSPLLMTLTIMMLLIKYNFFFQKSMEKVFSYFHVALMWLDLHNFSQKSVLSRTFNRTSRKHKQIFQPFPKTSNAISAFYIAPSHPHIYVRNCCVIQIIQAHNECLVES